MSTRPGRRCWSRTFAPTLRAGSPRPFLPPRSPRCAPIRRVLRPSRDRLSSRLIRCGVGQIQSHSDETMCRHRSAPVAARRFSRPVLPTASRRPPSSPRRRAACRCETQPSRRAGDDDAARSVHRQVSPKRSTRRELTPSGSNSRATRYPQPIQRSASPVPERDPSTGSARGRWNRLDPLEGFLHAARTERLRITGLPEERSQRHRGSPPARSTPVARGFSLEFIEERCPTGLPSSYWSMPVQPMNACHMTGLIQAFSNAVPANRGGSQLSSSSAGFTKTRPKPKPAWTRAWAFAS